MSDTILVTGGTGLVGRNLVAGLEGLGHSVVSVGSERDLRDSDVAHRLLAEVRPKVVFHLAARVGGIYANSTQKPGFYRDNVLINTHVIDAAVETGVEYVFAMGTGCAYPKRLEGAVLHEDDYLDGVPEPTNDAYAYAKRGMLVHLEALRADGALDYCFCLPANVYGPHDNFHPEHSHVVAALVRRFVEARDEGAPEVAIWGDGSARRDFLYISDCIDAMLLLLERRFSGVVNVATGEQISIGELAEAVSRGAGYRGEIRFDPAMPAGQSGRRFDIERIRSTGWDPAHTLADGLAETISWFETHRSEIRER
ncbi:MAG: NAD-dependent epimerase/dehydratase family protein [Gemmatimonadetes bacterium]|nr:NAD-dependent epimerase/dehydratase family protein [Gemmatimonadota bacterium]